MLDFKKVTLADRDWITAVLRSADSKSADHNFTNIYVWDDTFRQSVCRIGDRLAVKLEYEDMPFYAFPAGTGDCTTAINAMRRDADEHGIPFTIRGISKADLDLLESLYAGQFDITEARHTFDYVYSIEKLSTLSGKKLHAKKNHVNRFMRENDWTFSPMSENDIPACLLMTQKWYAESSEATGSDYEHEKNALSRAFRDFSALGLEGGVLRVSGEIVAYCIGEVLSSDTYITHFEKAFSTVSGAYSMINYEFAKHIRTIHPELLYVNREDDMGIENLRRAKESYYPEFMVEKYTAVWRQ